MTFHDRLLELESELLAQEEAARGIDQSIAECAILLDGVEREIGMRLGDNATNDWRGWLSFRRKDALLIGRGRAFAEGNFFKSFRAGLDCATGLDSITEYRRGFDVTPPQDLDHLLLNFGQGESIKVFLWYGENIAPYRLIYQADVMSDPTDQLHEAIVEACVWILKRPKSQTLLDFLKEFEKRPQ
jgi:hypothetical protein